nr:pentatricopeptide repeat-containing protein, mitochondrial [Quercus suber]
MSSSGFSMDEFTLGCFAQSLCKAGRWREAHSLFEKEEIVPNTVLYTKMISGLCEASLFEEAMDFLNRMRTSSCIPNVVTHRTLLCGCLRKRQLDQEIILMPISCLRKWSNAVASPVMWFTISRLVVYAAMKNYQAQMF